MRTVGCPYTAVRSLQGANMPTPLARTRTMVRRVVVAAGPARDGLTPNASPLWLGNKDVAASDGMELLPGDERDIEFHDSAAFDLAELFFVGAVATDVVRIAWWLADTAPEGGPHT